MNNYDVILDEKIKAAGLKYLEKLADEAPSEEELSALNISTNELDKRIVNTLKKLKGRSRINRVLRILSIAAAGLITLVGISVISITGSEALRIKFNDIFFAEKSGTAEFSADGELDTETMPEGSDFINPGYIPEGFELCQAMISTVQVSNTYISRDNNFIYITRSQTIGSVTYDTERSKHYEMQINGNRAIVVEHSEGSIVFYFSNNFFYQINGEGVFADELIKIAQKLPK